MMNFTKRFYNNYSKNGQQQDQSMDNTNEILNKYYTNDNNPDMSLYDSSVELGRSSYKSKNRYNDILADDATKESHYGYKMDGLRDKERYRSGLFSSAAAQAPASTTSRPYAYNFSSNDPVSDSFEKDIDNFLSRNSPTSNYQKSNSKYNSDSQTEDKTEILIHETHKIIDRLPSLNDNLNNLLSSSIDRLISELKSLKAENGFLKDKLNHAANKNDLSNKETIQKLTKENEKLSKVNDTFKLKLGKYKDLYEDSQRDVSVLSQKIEILNSRLSNNATNNKSSIVNNELASKIERLESKIEAMGAQNKSESKSELQNKELSQKLFDLQHERLYQTARNAETPQAHEASSVSNKQEKEFEKLQEQLNNFKTQYHQSQNVSLSNENPLDAKFSKLKLELDKLQEQERLIQMKQGQSTEASSSAGNRVTMEDLKNEIISLKEQLNNNHDDIGNKTPQKRTVSFQSEINASPKLVPQTKEDVDILKSLLSNNQDLYEAMIRLMNKINKTEKLSIKPCSICARNLCNHETYKGLARPSSAKSTASPISPSKHINIIIDELINKKNAQLSKEMTQEWNSMIPNLMKQIEISKLKALLRDDEDYQKGFKDDQDTNNDLMDDLKDGDVNELKENDTMSILGEHEWIL